MNSDILEHFKQSAETSLRAGHLLSADIARCASKLIEILEAGGKILICGNGGSAADAMHFSAELVVRFEHNRRGLAAIALSSDTATITATSNDFSFDQVFARQIEALGRAGDHLIVMTTSGNSSNLIAAVETAKRLGNISVTALTGRDGGTLASLLTEQDIELRVPSENTARIQEAHAIIIHILCGLVEGHFCVKTT